MAFYDEPQWAVVGDTFPVGCLWSKNIVYRDETFDENSDGKNPKYNTQYGIYKEKCGIENLTMSWGHDVSSFSFYFSFHWFISRFISLLLHQIVLNNLNIFRFLAGILASCAETQQVHVTQWGDSNNPLSLVLSVAHGRRLWVFWSRKRQEYQEMGEHFQVSRYTN